MTVTSRHDVRKEVAGTWTVFNIFTGVPVEIDRVRTMLLSLQEGQGGGGVFAAARELIEMQLRQDDRDG